MSDLDEISNRSGNRHFSEVLTVNLQRRSALKAGMGAAALSFFGLPMLMRSGEVAAKPMRNAATIGFKPIPAVPLGSVAAAADTDLVRVPQGYRVQVLYRWGDPVGIEGNMPEFRVENGVSVNTAAEQAVQAGMDHDGMHFFPLKDNPRSGNQKGLICINHENIQPEFLLPANMSQAEQVAKMKAAHGVAVFEVRQHGDEWRVKRPSKFARRFTADTPFAISGPAAGAAAMKTNADPAGTLVLGTLNNCANGATPWGTYLTCEENFNGYFGSTQTTPSPVTPHMLRYGVGTGGFGYRWHEVDTRFDIAVEPNESNRFGWVVEIDPYDPDSTPVKRTALGRFKHENAAFAMTADGRPVLYMGDDERNEYIYKFVSNRQFHADDDGHRGERRHARSPHWLDDGVLYVAVFEEGDADVQACNNASLTPPPNAQCDNFGKGRWVPLVWSAAGPLSPANGFGDQAEVLIKCRQAADRVGATMMDRPEWIAVQPGSNAVYCTLTNNNRRGGTTVNNPNGTTAAGSSRPPRDEANPRADNVYGHIIRWLDKDGDPAATEFNWDIFILAGDPADPGRNLATTPDPRGNYQGNSQGFPGFEDPKYHIFSAPDGLWFDPEGRLWIETDYGARPTGTQANMGNCHMLCADVATGRIGRFLVGPNGCEITGICRSPDGRSLFVNIQHPGEDGSAVPSSFSTFPDGTSPSRSATIVVTRVDGGLIGT